MLFEVHGYFFLSGYKDDHNGFIQPGAPSFNVGPIGASWGLDRSRDNVFGAAVGISDRSVAANNVPAEVANAAASADIPTNLISLRIQPVQDYGFDFYPIKGISLGYSFYRDSWRYDSVGNYSGTTVPR